MAVYKVPQDVEADDKLIGPFSFRQFVYLLIAAGLMALAAGLFQLFPLLVIVPIPPILLFLALALPLKKDQPMETYLAAIVSYYLKPRTRRWTPGQKESTILITAPKQNVDEVRTRDLSQEEATRRLSFLADVVDSEGYAIKGMANKNMRDDLVAEANATADMFENHGADNLTRAIQQEKEEQHAEVMDKMRAAIDRSESFVGMKPNRNVGESLSSVTPGDTEHHEDVIVSVTPADTQASSEETSSHSETETQVSSEEASSRSGMDAGGSDETARAAESELKSEQKDSIMELANNSDFSVATIAKEANRINRKDKGEVFISLH